MKIVFAYDTTAPYQVHCYDAAEWANGTRVVVHDERRRVDEGGNHRNVDDAQAEAHARARRYGDRASVVRG